MLFLNELNLTFFTSSFVVLLEQKVTFLDKSDYETKIFDLVIVL